MIEALGLSFGWADARVEQAERVEGDIVHVAVHCVEVAREQRLDKPVVIRGALLEPSSHHCVEAEHYLAICQRKFVGAPLVDRLTKHDLEVSVGKQQGPHGSRFASQLTEGNLLVKDFGNRASLQETLKIFLDLRITLAHEFARQGIAACVRPVWLSCAVLEVIGD